MTEIADRYARVAAAFTARLDAVGDDGWEQPTPCTEWNARDLVVHVVRTHRAVVARIDGEEPDEVDSAGDLGAQWRAASTAVGMSLDDEARAATVVGGMFGEQSFETLVGRLLCTDTLVHTWDLARGTGQDERLDADAVERAVEFLTPIDEAIRRPGGFAPKIEPAAGADEQTRFLNFCGRRP